ncbi:uncharacterized protein [Ptychodera flava]|uniref:uncharacterized protein n=1 Tax=Ptychodera flava TaxID=63121 RepID=UPI003969E782
MRCADCGTIENVSLCRGDLDLCPHCEEVRFPDIIERRKENAERKKNGKSKKTDSIPVTSDRAIVINELLCFLWNKIDILPQDMLVKLCVEAYDDKEVEHAKKLLFDYCSDDRNRYIRRQGQNKRANNVQDMLILLHELDENNAPCFVAYELSRLPPIDINHIDVSVLIKEIKLLQQEVSKFKKSRCSDDCGSLRADLTLLRNEFSVLKNSLDQQVVGVEPVPVPAVSRITDQSSSDKSDDEDTDVKELYTSSSYSDAIKRNRQDESVTGHTGNVHKTTPGAFIGVGQGVNLEVPTRTVTASNDGDFTMVKRRNRRATSKMRSTVTGANTTMSTSLKAANVYPPAELFVSRLQPNTTGTDIIQHLNKLGFIDIKAETLKTKYDSYASFKIITTADNSKALMNSSIWPSGILVRRFYPAKK